MNLPRIADLIRRNQLRLRLWGAFGGIFGAFLILVGALFVFALLFSLFPALYHFAFLFRSLSLLLAVAYVVYRIFHQTDTTSVARALDSHFRTADRLATALDFASRKEKSPLMQAQLAEAEHYAASTLKDAVLPLGAPRHTKEVLLMLLAGAVAYGPHHRFWWVSDRNPPPRVVALAKDAVEKDRALTRLEALAEKKELPRLAARLREARDDLRKNTREFEEKLDAPLWDLPPDARTEVMPHEDQALEPQELPEPPSPAEPPPPPVGGAMTALAAAQGLLDATPIGQFDAAPADEYAEAFAELDKMFALSPQMTAKELNELAQKIDKTAKVINNHGADAGGHAPGATGALSPQENMTARMGGALSRKGSSSAGHDRGIQDELGALMSKSFGEFLKRYSMHVKEEAVKRATHEAREDAKASMQVKLPPDKSASLSERKLAQADPKNAKAQETQQIDPNAAKEMMEKLLQSKGKEQISNKEDGAQVAGDRTEAGGKGSGRGSGDAKAQAETGAKGDENVDLVGQIGDGQSAIQVIRDYSKFGAAASAATPAMQEIYQGALQEAAEALSQPGIPDEMREYVKMYFLAIEPKKQEKNNGQ